MSERISSETKEEGLTFLLDDFLDERTNRELDFCTEGMETEVGVKSLMKRIRWSVAFQNGLGPCSPSLGSLEELGWKSTQYLDDAETAPVLLSV